MDFSSVIAAITGEITQNAGVVAGALGLALGVGFVMRLIRRAAK